MAAHGRSVPYSDADILAQLDESAQGYIFPILNSIDLHHADLRMTAFRSPAEWLLVIEEIVLFSEYSFQNVVSGFGNHCEPGPQLAIDDIVRRPHGQDVWNDDGSLALDPFDFTVSVHGEPRRFTPDKGDYRRHGGRDTPPAARLLRYLQQQVPGGFFQPEDELLRICGRERAGLELFLQVDDWRHPDVLDGELPSQNPCFRSLAAALAEGDPDLYECDPAKHNTHWSKWPKPD